MKVFFYFAMIICLCSCGQGKVVNGFDYSNFPITAKSLGAIKVGSHIADNDASLELLDKTATDAYTYHYGGGGKAWDYSYKGQKLFALLPARDTDSIIAIMVFAADFKMQNGLCTKSTVKQIIEEDPGLEIHMDLMSGGEFIWNERDNILFVFETTDDDLIAKYNDIDAAGVIKQASRTPDYITIK